jgi:hypothetical protein
MIDFIRKTKNWSAFKMALNDELFLACSAIVAAAAAGVMSLLIRENKKRKLYG